ncbi:uncharacterized protein BDR25DRAFT_340208 [Lindgomyces ingoldianus]|uniref:Uncharacterized protein n=1 Tax=Lindgomyces ingoldianus TaxID=673940 RepID=A0ACB6R879_9PLEO|nr:uncharacterized protein BDR25DRAFT_340208 [Lindgomyces ingoldianus]KAF2475464.1 hypothetical protein BDR25DRAFT_340208 [Lindgomyces ingoldianus]
MTSPMLDSRSPRVLDPHKKAHFSLHISDRITKNDSSVPTYSAVKYNHKPPQASSTRNATLTSSSTDSYELRLEDKDGRKDTDLFTFTGQKTAPKKSYILLFDPSSQKCTLEPLSSTYTFNLQSRNATDISSSHPKIFPRKQKDSDEDASGDVDDLFDMGVGDDNDDPDPNNPYDFRHFLQKGKDKEKRGYESEYHQSSPDYRTGTGSALNTPLLPPRKSAPSIISSTAVKPRTTQQRQSSSAPKPRKRKSPDADPFVQRKPTTKKQQPQPAPTVRLDRRASTRVPDPTPTSKSNSTFNLTTKPARKPLPKSQHVSSKIKSAELVHSSDESDIDADGSIDSSHSPHRNHNQNHDPPPHRLHSSPDVDADGDFDSDDNNTGTGALEIEVPDSHSRPSRSALKSLGLGQNLGLSGLGYLKSPSNGPISLATAASSVEGSPNPGFTPGRPGSRIPGRRAGAGGRYGHADGGDDDGVIDFGNLGGGASGGDGESDEEDGGYVEDQEDDDEDEDEGVDDRDVEPMDIGPPAQPSTTQQQQQQPGVGRKMSEGGLVVEEDEDDPLYKVMMEGLAGTSSEESEEE